MKSSALSLRASIAFVLGATLLPTPATADQPDGAGQPRRMQLRQGYLLVKPRAGLPKGKLEEELRGVEGQVERELRGLKVKLVKAPVGREAQFANALNRNSHVEFAEPDLLAEPVGVVNDPNYPSQ